MKYYEVKNGKLYPVTIHIWKNPKRWWREFKSFGPTNLVTTYSDTIQEYTRLKSREEQE